MRRPARRGGRGGARDWRAAPDHGRAARSRRGRAAARARRRDAAVMRTFSFFTSFVTDGIVDQTG